MAARDAVARVDDRARLSEGNSLAHVATLLAEAAEIVRVIGANQLAGPAPARLMGVVGADAQTTAPAPLLSLRQVAERLGVHIRTARRWRDEKYLPPAIVLGGVVRFDAAEIEEWIEAKKEGTR